MESPFYRDPGVEARRRRLEEDSGALGLTVEQYVAGRSHPAMLRRVQRSGEVAWSSMNDRQRGIARLLCKRGLLRLASGGESVALTDAASRLLDGGEGV